MRRALWLSVLLLATACAQVGRPPGGPADKTPPVLGTVEPGSLAVDVPADAPLVFTFSEKVDRRGFASALKLVPDVELSRPSFDGLTVKVSPRSTWPPDSVVVWTLAGTLKDKHGVASGAETRGAFTTGASLPPGIVRGQASWEDPDPKTELDWTQLRAELSLPPPEGSRRRELWRVADGDAVGRFELSWLRIPSGPFGLEVWLDRDGNGKRDPREPVAELDSLFLAGPDSILDLARESLILVDREAPVPVRFCLNAAPRDSFDVWVWTQADDAERPKAALVDSTGCVPAFDLVPGDYEWGAWVDLDADGRFGADSLGVSEPWLPRRELEVLPAFPDSLSVDWPDSLLPWAELDSLSSPPVPEDLHRSPPDQEGR